MRRRINISVDEATYQGMLLMAEEYQFNSACELASTLLKLFLKRVQRNEEIQGLSPEETNEIDDMFAELMDYEPTPFNTHVPVIRRPRRNSYGEERDIQQDDPFEQMAETEKGDPDEASPVPDL